MEDFTIKMQINMVKLFADDTIFPTQHCENCIKEGIITFHEEQVSCLTESIISSISETIVTSLSMILLKFNSLESSFQTPGE